jgi:hypothetical protein
MPTREEAAVRGIDVATTAEDELHAVARPPFRDIDATARLQDPLADLDVPDTSLGNFVRMISGLSTVPITVRPEALVNSKLSLAADVSARAEDTTIGEALAAALSPLKLALAVNGPDVIIDRRGAIGGELRIAKHAVADLVDSSRGNAEDFLRLLRTVVASRSWSDHGGDGRAAFMNGELILNQSEHAHFEALYFFERLREARGLAPRSRYVAKLFPVNQSRRQLGEAMLSSALLLRTKRPTDFSDVVWQLSQRTGYQIVVDWQSLVAEGWLPETQVNLSGKARSLAAALDELLLPMGLTYRVIKADLLQITTVAAELTYADIEFYPVADFLDRGAVPRTLIEQLKQHVGAGYFEPPAPGAAAFDADSQCLIVRLPQSKQPLVTDFLASQR